MKKTSLSSSQKREKIGGVDAYSDPSRITQKESRVGNVNVEDNSTIAQISNVKTVSNLTSSIKQHHTSKFEGNS